MISNAPGQSTGYTCEAYWVPERCFPVAGVHHGMVAGCQREPSPIAVGGHHVSPNVKKSSHIRKWSSPNGQFHSNSLHLFDGETSTALTNCVFRPNPQRRNSWAIDVPKLGVVSKEAFQIVGVLAHRFSTQFPRPCSIWVILCYFQFRLPKVE